MKRKCIWIVLLCVLTLLSACGGRSVLDQIPVPSFQLPEAPPRPVQPAPPSRPAAAMQEETAQQPPAPEPYYLHAAPLVWRWIGESTEDSFAYELNILPTGGVYLLYHDYRLAPGLGEENVTWRAGGDVRQEGELLCFTLSADGAEFSGAYLCHLEPGGLFLQNCGTEHIFAALEREAEENGSEAIYFRRELPRIAYLAPAFVLCGVYEQKAACERHFWEVIDAAVCLDRCGEAAEAEPLPARLQCSAAETADYARALFGTYFTGALPDTAGSLVTVEGDVYSFPLPEEAAACRVEGVELLYEGPAMLNGGVLVEVFADGDAPVYLTLRTQTEDGAPFGAQLTALAQVRPVFGEEGLAGLAGTHSYYEFAEPNINMDYTLTIPAEDGAAALQIQGFQTDETLPLRLQRMNGVLCALYAGEATALYDEGCPLFTLRPTPEGNLTLTPLALCTLHGAELEECQ